MVGSDSQHALQYEGESKELIDGGDMSCCWTKDRWTGKKVAEYVNENIEAAEYGPQYYSQRGEDCPPRLDSNLIEYLNDMEEFAYVYTQNQEWVCFKNQYDDAPAKVAIPEGALAV